MVLQNTPAGMFYVLSTGQFEHLGKSVVELKTLLEPEFRKEIFQAIFVFAIWNDTASWQTQE